VRQEHCQTDLAYAIVEGVSFGLTDGLQAMRPETGSRPEELMLIGGGASSDFWAHLLASTLNCRLRRSIDCFNAAALGAAKLAVLADGGEIISNPQAITDELFEPLRVLREALQLRHQRFKALYTAVEV
jgi:xylulokinase